MSTMKIRIFANKTRAQNIEFWPNGGHFRADKNFLIFFQKLDFSVVFEKILNFIFDFGLLDIALNAYTKFQGQTTI